MAVERTLSIIKPDAVAKNVIGQIYARFEANGLKIIAARMMHLSRREAEGFYAVHRERPFFKDLVEFVLILRRASMPMQCMVPTPRKQRLWKLPTSFPHLTSIRVKP